MHTDIRSGDWVDRYLPDALRPYARLARLDRPIGTWLLLLPCWWGLALASEGLPDARLLALFVIGALVMRGAGCVINDMWDRHLDKLVERTRIRPLASGALSFAQAAVFLFLLLAIGLLVLLQLSPATIWLGLLSVPLFVLYPLAKRVTWWPQFVLGLTFNWGALLGFLEGRGQIGLTALLLYAGGVFWTLAYDTIYATQDRADDEKSGIKSLALHLGDKVRFWIAGFFDAAMILLFVAGWRMGLGWGFYALMALAYGHALWQLLGWRQDDPASALERFRSNRDFGLIVFVALVAGKFI